MPFRTRTGRPVHSRTAGARITPTMSTEQRDYIGRLLAERHHRYSPDALAALHATMDGGHMTVPDARAVITRLLAAPRRPLTSVAPGMYLLDGVVYRVQLTQDEQRTYAVELLTPPNGRLSWQYHRGAIHRLTPDHRMTLTQAVVMSQRIGTCCVCARAPFISVRAGISPDCASKL